MVCEVRLDLKGREGWDDNSNTSRSHLSLCSYRRCLGTEEDSQRPAGTCGTLFPSDGCDGVGGEAGRSAGCSEARLASCCRTGGTLCWTVAGTEAPPSQSAAAAPPPSARSPAAPVRASRRPRPGCTRGCPAPTDFSGWARSAESVSGREPSLSWCASTWTLAGGRGRWWPARRSSSYGHCRASCPISALRTCSWWLHLHLHSQQLLHLLRGIAQIPAVVRLQCIDQTQTGLKAQCGHYEELEAPLK